MIKTEKDCFGSLFLSIDKTPLSVLYIPHYGVSFLTQYRRYELRIPYEL